MSKQLTPMQELIEYLEKYKEVIGMTAVMIIDKAKSLLPAERKMVEDEMEREAVGFHIWCGTEAGMSAWEQCYTTAQLYQLYKAKVNE